MHAIQLIHLSSLVPERSNGFRLVINYLDYPNKTSVNKYNAFELYQKAANLGNNITQFNLVFMY